jgi:hypothetical protein
LRRWGRGRRRGVRRACCSESGRRARHGRRARGGCCARYRWQPRSAGQPRANAGWAGTVEARSTRILAGAPRARSGATLDVNRKPLCPYYPLSVLSARTIRRELWRRAAPGSSPAHPVHGPALHSTSTESLFVRTIRRRQQKASLSVLSAEREEYRSLTHPVSRIVERVANPQHAVRLAQVLIQFAAAL